MGSRHKGPVLLLRCDVMVSDAFVHVLSNGASARWVNALSGDANQAAGTCSEEGRRLAVAVQHRQKEHFTLVSCDDPVRKKEKTTPRNLHEWL